MFNFILKCCIFYCLYCISGNKIIIIMKSVFFNLQTQSLNTDYCLLIAFLYMFLLVFLLNLCLIIFVQNPFLNLSFCCLKPFMYEDFLKLFFSKCINSALPIGYIPHFNWKKNIKYLTQIWNVVYHQTTLVLIGTKQLLNELHILSSASVSSKVYKLGN